MIAKEHITDFINRHLEGSDKFLVEVKVSAGDKISIFIDGDNGITIDDCRMLTRAIETAFSRDEEDYDLTVSSAGADKPLKLPRQYPRHTGRTIEIKTVSGETFTGKLKTAGPVAVALTLQSGKKAKQELVIEIPFNEIKEGKILLSFK